MGFKQISAVTAVAAMTLASTTSWALAEDMTILVGQKKSAAYDSAKSMANGADILAAKSLAKAFTKAGEHLKTCGVCTVDIKVAAGDFYGKGKTGHWMFPDVIAPDARLRILGGYDDSFSARAPFKNQTRLITADVRGRPVLQFEGRKHALKELYLSGLTFDVAPGNAYDAQNNSLRKDSSSSFSVLAFGYLTTDKLVIADNTFLNAANGVAQPLMRAMSGNAQVVVRNNFVMNNIMAWKVASASYRNLLRSYTLANNSFILNWPYNPDPTTSNPGALEIGDKYSSAQVTITKNLFAYNAGGGIHAQWDDVKGPPMAITDNLFWGNGSLFNSADPDAAAVLGKFNGSPRYVLLTSDDAEDFDWDVENNVSFDPGLHVQVKPFQAAGSKSAVMAAGAAAPASAEGATAPAPAGDVDPAMAELAALLGEDAVGDMGTGDAAADPAPADDIYGGDEFTDLGFGEDGDVQIQGYATRLFVDGALPFPTNAQAAGYGASADLVEQF
ncbi:hypothetical protein ACFL12_05425 [Pseudomonadota bacterium]